MTLKQAIRILERHNKWRRDNIGKFEMADPKELGIAIDILVAFAKDNYKIKSTPIANFQIEATTDECLALTEFLLTMRATQNHDDINFSTK